MKDLRGPAAVSEEFFQNTTEATTLGRKEKMMIREPEDLHRMKEQPTGNR